MRAVIAFVKKEFMEYTRTYKLLIVFAVFLLIGMLNPITAKLTPEILSSFMPDNMSITISPPSALDSWVQFYKNIGMAITAFVIIFSGIISNEISKGTLVNILTKGLSRKAVILSKFISTIIIWTLAYAVCFMTTYGYTLYLLPGKLPNIFFSAFCMWLFGIMITGVIFLGGVLFSNIYGSLIVTGGFTVCLMLFNISPKLQKYNPYLLASGNMSLLSSDKVISDFYISIVVSIIVILVLIISSILCFNKKQL